MDVAIVVFQLPPKSRNLNLTKFCQRFYGQYVSSWGGKYRYWRHGLLDTIPFRKLGRGVIILRKEDLDPVLHFLQEWNATVEVRIIVPVKEDLATLRDNTP
jgi:hypothetical protein